MYSNGILLKFFKIHLNAMVFLWYFQDPLETLHLKDDILMYDSFERLCLYCTVISLKLIPLYLSHTNFRFTLERTPKFPN